MKKVIISMLLFGILTTAFTGCGNNSGFNADKTINAITREEGSGTRGAFIELFNLEENQDE